MFKLIGLYVFFCGKYILVFLGEVEVYSFSIYDLYWLNYEFGDIGCYILRLYFKIKINKEFFLENFIRKKG